MIFKWRRLKNGTGAEVKQVHLTATVTAEALDECDLHMNPRSSPVATLEVGRSISRPKTIKTLLPKRFFSPMVYFAHKICVYTFVLHVLVCRECDFNITHKNATITFKT